MENIGSVNKGKKVYVQPMTGCSFMQTGNFMVGSTKPIPGVGDNTDPDEVLETVDCCISFNGITPGGTQNSEAVLTTLINQGCIPVVHDGECATTSTFKDHDKDEGSMSTTDGCWLTDNSITYIKIVKVGTGYYYEGYTNNTCSKN